MPDTRSRLIDAARHLFRRHGYHGVGLSAILTEARASKGSLYHAFPAGKPDLALAAADAASAEILAGIATAFAAVRDYPAGVAALLRAFADDFDAGARAAPVTPLLPPDDPAFRTHAALIRGRWIRALAYQAIRLGENEASAEDRALVLLLALEGAFILAAERGNGDLIRTLPQRIAR